MHNSDTTKGARDNENNFSTTSLIIWQVQTPETTTFLELPPAKDHQM